MKTRIYITAGLLAISALAGSCDLDREPKVYIEYSKSFNNAQDAKKWDNGIYSTLRKNFGGPFVLPQEVQADMLNAHIAYNGSYELFHNWRVKAEEQAFKDIYHSYYAALVDVNIVLERLPELSRNASASDAEQFKVYMGNAYFARAFYHFNLSLRWGRPYRAESAATDLAVPLRTEPFKLDKPARATNEVTYKLILEDLQQAEDLLSGVKLIEGNKELSSDAVRALRARVYLYMGDMQNALAEAKALIATARYPLIAALADGEKDPEGERHPFVQMWHYDNGREQIWLPHVDKPREVPPTIPLYGADLDTYTYWANRGIKGINFNKPAYLPSGTVIYDLFLDEADRRVPAYFEYVTTTAGDKETQAELFVISKFKGNPKFSELVNPQWGGYVPNGICSPKPFRIAEQYLIAAEAASILEQNAEALFYLSALRASRGLSTEATLVGDELRNAIRNERSRELAYEGFRLWDLRRWGLGFAPRQRQGRVAEHRVDASFFAPGFDKVAVEAHDPRFIWPFPQDEVGQVNKNLIQNEGW